MVFSLRDDPRFVDGCDFEDGDLARAPIDTIALSLENSRVTNVGVASLSRLNDLRCLDLDGTVITDEALRAIACIRSIEELWIEGTGVTDAGLSYLKELENLRFLSVAYCDAVSDQAIADLKSRLPLLEVEE